ncbi:hypothetical protein, partial [Escherichia coli]|uniref:hypothetical protein n=1 Tax=Escherichia coli TaxID=562 RepID=UPI0034A57915
AISPERVTEDNFIAGILTFYNCHVASAVVSMSTCTARSVTLRATKTQEYDIGLRILYRP